MGARENRRFSTSEHRSHELSVDYHNSISGYVPLRSNERTNEEEAYLSLSRWER